MLRPHMFSAVLMLASVAAAAAEPAPEIRREPAAPQAVGIVHTLRVIPEACARLEGTFTGNASTPYKFATVRTSDRCQARARFVEAAKAKPSATSGWILNDVIRVPSAACAAQQAVVRVWRKDIKAQPPKLDAQGRSRIYLKEGMDAAKAGDLQPIPVYAAAMAVEGIPCK